MNNLILFIFMLILLYSILFYLAYLAFFHDMPLKQYIYIILTSAKTCVPKILWELALTLGFGLLLFFSYLLMAS